MLYVVKTGRQWRFFPKEFPPWQTVYDLLRHWRLGGTWDPAMKTLRKNARSKIGKNAQPSVAIIDSRSVKTAGKGGRAVLMPAKRSRAASNTSR